MKVKLPIIPTTTKRSRGFMLIEILVVMAIIILLGVIGLESYDAFAQKQRDDQRILDLHRFAQKLEQFRTAHGTYVCGDNCIDKPTGATFYSFDCSSEVGNLTGSETEEINGFLNGGDCCIADGGYPTPTSTTDDSSWGLYRHGYLETSEPKDPAEGSLGNNEYTYCYATPAAGRGEFALYAKLEASDAGLYDGGYLDDYYEILSANFSADGWWPGYVPPPWCGDGIVNGTEQCDEGVANNSDAPNATCRTDCKVRRCGDGIIDNGAPYNENCEGSCVAPQLPCTPPPPSYTWCDCGAGSGKTCKLQFEECFLQGQN